MPPLSEGAGYAVVVGFGAFFSIFTTILVFLDYRFGGTKQTSEQVCDSVWCCRHIMALPDTASVIARCMFQRSSYCSQIRPETRSLPCVQFNCGGRSIKQGLIAVDIVSHCKSLPYAKCSAL